MDDGDDQRNLLLNWTYLYQEKSMDELRQSLLLTMELEDSRLRIKNELMLKDQQIAHLRELLGRAIQERDEAQEKCRKVLCENILLQQKLQCRRQSTPHSGISSIDDDPRKGGIESNYGFSSSDSDESIVSSPHRMPPPPAEAEPEFPVEINRPLPEKGKLLQAVMKAGPLLQTLLLAGPLPQWRHPPPPVDAYQIPPPPVVVPPSPLPAVSAQFLRQDSLQSGFNNVNNNCGRMITRKRGLPEFSDSTNELKYQRVVLQ